jgi:hypothetical protein
MPSLGSPRPIGGTMPNEDRELSRDFYEFMGFAKSQMSTHEKDIEKLRTEITSLRSSINTKCETCIFAKEFPAVRNKTIYWSGGIVTLGIILNLVIKFL